MYFIDRDNILIDRRQQMAQPTSPLARVGSPKEGSGLGRLCAPTPAELSFFSVLIACCCRHCYRPRRHLGKRRTCRVDRLSLPQKSRRRSFHGFIVYSRKLQKKNRIDERPLVIGKSFISDMGVCACVCIGVDHFYSYSLCTVEFVVFGIQLQLSSSCSECQDSILTTSWVDSSSMANACRCVRSIRDPSSSSGGGLAMSL